MRILNCYMANDSKGAFCYGERSSEAQPPGRFVLCVLWMPVNTSAGQ